MLPPIARRVETAALSWTPYRVSPRAAVVICLALFWAVLRMAALQQPGYDLNRDTISSLASNGANDAWIGIGALGLAGLGMMLLSRRTARVTPPGALSLVAAGIALMVVAGSRITCPDGAAGCEMIDATSPFVGQIHMTATVLYQVTFLVATACVAVATWRRGARAWPIIALLGMMLSVGLFAAAPLGVGVAQRMWMLSQSLLLAGPLAATRD